MKTTSPAKAIHSGVRAVLFDMDGTITKPYFDFVAVRKELGLDLASTTPILESLERMDPDSRARAEAILHRIEEQGALESEIQDDAHGVLLAIRSAGLPIGLITRNSRRSVETVLAKHHLAFDRIHSREDGPVKPAPDAVLKMCRDFNVEPTTAWLVGDYLFDMLSGNAAGATTVLMINHGPEPEFAHLAGHVIRTLSELLPLIGITK